MLSDVLNQERLPALIGGGVTAPSASVRVLHDASAPTGHRSDILGTLEGRFHLAGCTICGNTAEVTFLVKQVAEEVSSFQEIQERLSEALEMELDESYGRLQQLAYQRSYEDPRWYTRRAEDEPEDFTEVHASIMSVVNRHREDLFSGGYFSSERSSKELVLAPQQSLSSAKADFILSQVPHRRCEVGEEGMVLVHVPKRNRAPYYVTQRHYRPQYGKRVDVLETGRPNDVLLSPEYDTVWQLALEILGNQVEELRSRRDQSPVDFSSILTAAEAACL